MKDGDTMASKNPNGAGTIRQRKDGIWEARFINGRDPATGKLIRKSVYGSTQQEVRKKLNAVTAAIDNGEYKEPSKLTIQNGWISGSKNIP